MEEEKSKEIIFQQLLQDLEDLESYLRDLWQFLPLPICYLNPYRIILDVNLALENFFSFSFEELIGQNVKIFFSEKKFLEDLFEEILAKKKIINRECEVITKNGEKKFVHLSASTREDKEGNLIGYYFSFSDISELKKLQLELDEKIKERTKELQERIEELEKFHRLVVERELKMIELKEEIEKLKKLSENK
jgi:PAS domain S-box-containing protein